MMLVCAFAGAAPARPPQADLPGPVVPDGLGVNIHFIEPQERDLDMIAAAGFRFIRMDFIWEVVEPQPGEFNFAGYDRLVTALAARKIRPLFILDYGHRILSQGVAPATAEARQAFARFGAAAAKQFAGRGVVWEIWNEPNIHFWKPEPDVSNYMALVKVLVPAMRAADPQCLIVAPATSTFAWEFMETCFQQGLLGLVDGITVHPYRGEPPETASADYARLRDLVRKYAPRGQKNLPILSGEWGYSVTHIPAERQGQYLARQFLTNLMNGVNLSIWYDWHDDGQDPKEGEHNFGTVTYDYQLKPAYRAARTLIAELSGYRFRQRLDLDSPDDYALVFGKGRSRKLVCWTTGEPHTVSLPQLKAAAITGLTSEKSEVQGPVRLELSGSPQYLTPKGPAPLLR